MPFATTRRSALQLMATSLCLPAALPVARGAEVAGVQLPDVLQLGGSTLKLNGAGIRFKAVFKVYTAGLYLTQPASTFAQVRSTPGPKSVHITMLRDIDATELGKLFSQGIQDNLERGAFGRIIPDVARMGEIFARYRQLQSGDAFRIDWLPGNGTLITVRNEVQNPPFAEPAFFDALLGIWLGPHPAEGSLKDALLGHPRT